ncbi:hypothetical protein OF83DRAFT_1053656 [Amylostereum chailletii]|nr:hypothetical protein OF83DRAFT_1053656 [Amylostereum chailletii]
MAATPSDNVPPWPGYTPAPSPSKRRRRRSSDDFHARRALNPRQIFNQSGVAEAVAQCGLIGNEVISCFPTTDSVVPQHEWATFVWNSNRPQLTQTDKVNIYLFHADSGDEVTSFLNYTNPRNQAGQVRAFVNDSWFPGGGLSWSGSDIQHPYYWIITRADQSLDDGTSQRQAIFTAVQTTFADSVTSSIASVSSASIASTASVASASSVSSSPLTSGPQSSTTTGTPRSTPVNPSGDGTGSLQGGNGNGFPDWAIAVIVVLGFLAIVAIGILAFLIMRRIRRNERMSSQRNSMGSASPMMPGAISAVDMPHSPVMEESGHRMYDPPVSLARAASVSSPNDDASMISHAQSHAHSTGDSGLFSGADAAIMADAFRKVLRKPDFAGRPIEEGDSPETQEPKQDEALMNWELAEEGRDIRSVGSSRGVRVENMSDGGDTTTQDHP